MKKIDKVPQTRCTCVCDACVQSTGILVAAIVFELGTRAGLVHVECMSSAVNSNLPILSEMY